jgi:hypothetical protein
MLGFAVLKLKAPRVACMPPTGFFLPGWGPFIPVPFAFEVIGPLGLMVDAYEPLRPMPPGTFSFFRLILLLVTESSAIVMCSVRLPRVSSPLPPCSVWN